jgi:hypothetical protein
MVLTKIYATAATILTATILVIAAAAATTTTSFPNITTAFATLQATEQLGDNATTGTTTTPPGAAEGGGQQQPIHITKDGTNSYVLSGGSSRVGSFDTTYRVVGERSAIRSAENLIISTITEDFRSSPTIGYIRAGGEGGGATGTGTTLPSPFASHEQITERITTELRRAITEAESNTPQGQHVEIKCDFGMSLEEMRCHVPSAGAAGGAGALATEEPTAPTDTETPTAPFTNDTGATTDDTTAPIFP